MIPSDWDSSAHGLWVEGDQIKAIDQALAALNSHKGKKPIALIMQVSYYLFFLNDYKACAEFLSLFRNDYPEDPNLLRNLGIALSRSNRYPESIEAINKLLEINQHDFVAYDSLARSYSRTGQFEEARQAGIESLRLKNATTSQSPAQLNLPKINPEALTLQSGKQKVISFSLWGSGQCYLRGALDNLIACRSIYPDWTVRFYVDSSVPADLLSALTSLDAEIVKEVDNQTTRQKLCWRFKVANDETVSRFLIRDVDSRVSLRELKLVTEWEISNTWFHVIRDWWTHTDLILAGMWGGMAGLLPNLEQELSDYESGTAETPNIDQWFLRDVVWPYIRSSCLIHDRFYGDQTDGQTHIEEPDDNFHIGQNEYEARKQAQEIRLCDWMPRLDSLQQP